MTPCMQSDNIINRICFYFKQVDGSKSRVQLSNKLNYKTTVQSEHLVLLTDGSLYTKTGVKWFEGPTGKTTEDMKKVET